MGVVTLSYTTFKTAIAARHLGLTDEEFAKLARSEVPPARFAEITRLAEDAAAALRDTLVEGTC